MCRKMITTITFVNSYHYKKLQYLLSIILLIVAVVVQLPSHVWLFATPWTTAHQAICPSPSPRVCPSSCPLNQWCHPTISSSVALFSFCLQSFPASGSFPMSQQFTSGGQSIGAPATASVLPMNIQGWFPLGWTGLISLQSKGLSRANTRVQKHRFFGQAVGVSQSCNILPPSPTSCQKGLSSSW